MLTKPPIRFETVHVPAPPAGSADEITLPLPSPATHSDAEGQSIVSIVLPPSTFCAADHVNGPAAEAGATATRKASETSAARAARGQMLRAYAESVNPGEVFRRS